MTMFATARSGRFIMIEIRDVNTGKLVVTLRGQTSFVQCLAWTVDGKTLVSGSDDGSITTWSTTSWREILVLDAHMTNVSAIAISPNGRILASASSDRTARLWNFENGQPIGSPLKHANIVACVSFSADGKSLATGCYDHNAYTWDVSALIRETGLGDLSLDPIDGDNLLSDVDAPPAQQIQDDIQVPPEIVGDSPDRVDFPPTHQPTHATSVPALDHLPTSSTHESATLAPSSTSRRFSSFFRRSRPDSDVAPHLSPRPWLGFFSRRAPSARTVGQRKSRLYVAPAPNTKATSKGQLKQHPNKSGALPLSLLRPQAADASTTSPLAPRPAVTTPVDVASTLDGSIREAGCCTRFWSCVCCASTARSPDIQ
ncbi:WD40-repeat-containing domain protein [Suillus subluteus]|nr:WD40-repeat-containing domain protein [Suillus subluteus]